MIIINFHSNNEQTIGENGEKLIHKIRQSYYNSNILIAPNLIDIKDFINKFKMPTIAQNISHSSSYDSMGHISAKALSSIGAIGAILNSPEHRIGINTSYDIINECKENGILSFLYAYNVEDLSKSLALGADYQIFKPSSIKDIVGKVFNLDHVLMDIKSSDMLHIGSLIGRIKGFVIPPDVNMLNLINKNYAQ